MKMPSFEELLSHLERGVPLSVSPEIDALAEQVIASQENREVDLEAWAEALAIRISQYDD